MKKVISLLLSIVMIVGLAGCSSQPKPETFIVGDWECISIIGNNREQRFTEEFYKLTVNRDNSATFAQEDFVAEYTWLFDSYDESNSLCEYSFNTEGIMTKVYHNAEKDTMILYEEEGDKSKAAIFRKAGTDIIVKDDTVYNVLLGMNFDAFGLEYIMDNEAYDMILGNWAGTTLYIGDDTTNLWLGALSMEITDGKYSITMLGETREGNLEFRGNLDNMPTFNMDGDYEGALLVYDEEMGMLMIYDQESEAGMLFIPV